MEGEFTKKNTVFPQQSLLALVSSTPPEFQVQITDEYLEDGPFADPADIIGVRFMTPQTLQTYQIGDKIQKLCKKAGWGFYPLHFSLLSMKLLSKGL